MERLADFIFRRAKLIIAAVIIINIAALFSFLRFDLDTKFLNFFSEGNAKADIYNELTNKYSNGEVITIFIEDKSSLLTKENLQAVFELRKQAGAINGVSQALSFIPLKIMNNGQAAEINADFIEENYEALADFIDTQYFMTNQFLTDNHLNGVIIVNINPEASASEVVSELEIIVSAEKNLSLSLVGNEVIQQTIWGYLWKILIFLIPCAIFLILFIFYSVIKNRRLAIFSMIPAGLAALWLMGTMFWTGGKINIFLVLSPIFIIVMGSADGLHYVSHWLENVRQTNDKRELIRKTLNMVGLPLILTTITTMAGFGSLIWTEVAPMRQMGFFVMLGIFYAGIISLFFLPAVLTLIKVPEVKHKIKQSRLAKIILLASKKRVAIIIIFAALVAVSGFYIPKLEVVSNQLMFFKSGSEIRRSFDKVEQQFGGAFPLSGEVASANPTADLKNPAFIEQVLIAERQLEQLNGVHQVYSLFDIIQNAQALYPGTEINITEQLDKPTLNSWISDSGFRLAISTKNLKSEDIDLLEKFVADNQIINAVTGMPILFNEMNKLVVKGQFQSLGLALFLIFIMLLVTLRKLKAALVGIIPIAITIICLLGMLSISRFNLNMLTANLSAIVIGVGVDYAIHLISSIYYYRKQGLNDNQSVNQSLTSVSRPIIANAFGLSIGLSVLFFSPLWIHTQVAAVMWVAMVISSLGALLLIPLFYRQKIFKY